MQVVFCIKKTLIQLNLENLRLDMLKLVSILFIKTNDGQKSLVLIARLGLRYMSRRKHGDRGGEVSIFESSWN